jgi:hypothetical protein
MKQELSQDKKKFMPIRRVITKAREQQQSGRQLLCIETFAPQCTVARDNASAFKVLLRS